MKKFSWIFALILALSIGFIGCPSDDDGDDPVTPPSGPPAYVPDPNAADISITFGASDTVVSTTGVGTRTYYSSGGSNGYTYEYATTGENIAYGNAIVRFPVDLGEFHLGDYGGIQFKWEGLSGDVGFSSGRIDYTKNLFVLATVDEGDISSYVADGAIKAFIANTTYFDINPTAELYAGAAGVPGVKGGPDMASAGTPPWLIRTPFVKFQTMTGEIFLSFHHHATGGSYRITDVKLLTVANYAAAGGNLNPPPAPAYVPEVPPEGIPEGYVTFDLDITDNDYTTPSGASINDVKPTITGSGPIDVTFAEGETNQRLIIALSDAQKAQVLHTVGNIVILIDGSIKTNGEGDADGDQFRLHIGDKESGSGWPFTTGSGGDPNKFANIKLTTHGRAALAATNEPNYFILQHRNNTKEITLTINKITIGVQPNNMTFESGDVTASDDATVTLLGTGKGFTFEPTSYGGSFATFKVTLTDETLADYSTICLSFKDQTYKKVVVLISEEPPTSVDSSGTVSTKQSGGGDDPEVTTDAVDFTGAANFGDLKDLDEFYISLYVWTNSGAFDIFNIALY